MSEQPTRLSTRDIAEAGRREEALQRHRAELPRDAKLTAATPAPAEQARAADTSDVSLFPHEEADGFRARWEAIQTGFVDEPKSAVAEADALVAQVVTRLAEVFSDEKNALEQQWGRGDSVSTEDLRIALKRYRAFFQRLLSV
jgi:predicted lipid-binding transport protein (Tim44 family)